MITLSICIPTYNFGKFLGKTLDSLLAQITQEIEIIVLDGGSTDDTAEVVQERQKNYAQLSYHYQNFRGGIDRDIEKVVSLAKGKYCWLISADDLLIPGALDKVLNSIRSNFDVYLCEHILCTFEMDPIHEHPPLINQSGPRLFDLRDSEQKRDYFRLARTSEAFFSFLSSPIFKKELWDLSIVPDAFHSTCWIVAGRLLNVMSKGYTIYYMHEKLLYKRSENDSFAKDGLVNRCRISIENFRIIAHTIFGENSEKAFHVGRVLHFDITLIHLLRLKLATSLHPEVENIHELNRIVKMHYKDRSLKNWTKYMIYALTPSSLLLSLKKSKFRKWTCEVFKKYSRKKLSKASNFQ